MQRSLLILLFGWCLLANAALANELLELACNSDAQCEQYERATCNESHCKCTDNNNKHVTCKPKDRKYSNIIGGACTTEHRCPQPHAECVGNPPQCYCAADYTPSEDRRRCLPQAVPLNEQCETTEQCQANDKSAVCQKSQRSCLCKQHFEQHEQLCLAVLDVSCRNDSMCSARDAICLSNLEKCACPAGSVHNHNMTLCMPGASFGDSCTTNAQCQLTLGNAGVCSNHSCGCNTKHYAKSDANNGNYTNNRTSCAPIAKYGAYCRSNEDCRQNMGEEKDMELQCKWGECSCRDTHQVVDNEHCVLIVSAASKQQQLQNTLLALIHIFWLIYSRM